MAPHSSTLAWKIPWMEEPGRLQSMGSQRVGHDWVTSLWLFTFMHWRRKWQPTPVFLPGESQGRGSLVAAVYGVAQSWTWLKRLSSSSRVLITGLSFFYFFKLKNKNPFIFKMTSPLSIWQFRKKGQKSILLKLASLIFVWRVIWWVCVSACSFTWDVG